MSVRLLALVCSAFLFLFSPFVFAQSNPEPFSERIWWKVQANRLTAELNRLTGTSSSPATPASLTDPSAKGLSVSNQANQWPSLRTKTPAPLPPGYGKPVIDVEARVVPSSAAGAIGRFLRKGVPLLSTGVALYELGQELGFGLDNSSGELVVMKNTPLPEGYDGYEYREQTTSGTTWYKTRQLACVGYAASAYTGSSNYYTCVGPSPSNWLYFQVQLRAGDGSVINTQDRLYTRRTDPSPPSTAPQPSSVDEFEDAIEVKSGWPVNSAISRSLADAIASGEGVQTQTPTVSGPSSTPGPVTTTTDAVNNTTTTSTTTHNHTYSGDTVTTTSTTTNITINNTTGAVTNSTTTTTTPVFPEQDNTQDDVSFSNSDLPPIPKLYEPEYPEGLVGVWNSKKAELDSAPLVDLVRDLMPNVGSGGTCPVWTMPLDFGFFNAGVLDFSVPCWIWDFAKVVIIVSALLLARRLVFGG